MHFTVSIYILLHRFVLGFFKVAKRHANIINFKGLPTIFPKYDSWGFLIWYSWYHSASNDTKKALILYFFRVQPFSYQPTRPAHDRHGIIILIHDRRATPSRRFKDLCVTLLGYIKSWSWRNCFSNDSRGVNMSDIFPFPCHRYHHSEKLGWSLCIRR